MPADLELCYLSATEAMASFHSGAVSPVEVLNAQIERFHDVNELINAVTYTHFDDALVAAAESERRYRDGSARPLEGVTVGVKDEHGLAGWTVTQGSALYEDAMLDHNDPVADKLVDAGAILHLQTTVPEFYLAAVTWSELWGVTRNPWNLDYAVGGSSGGSGAALAAGLCTLATGSDMGGSIRIPCAFNGLYGFKPPYGRVPTEAEPLLLIASSGPMARRLPDVIEMQNVISGPHPNAPTAIAPRFELPVSYEGLDGIRLAYSPDQSWATVDAETTHNTEAAVASLRAQGAIVDQVDLDLQVTAADISAAFAEAALHGPIGEVMSSIADRGRLTTYGRYFAEKADAGFGPADALKFQQNLVAANRRLHDIVWSEGYDALLIPTLATSHIPADHDFTTDEVVIEGTSVHSLLGWPLTPLFNLLYTYPVVGVPTGRTAQGMPTGLQIAGRPYDDATPFRIASGYADAAPPLFAAGEFPDFRSG